VTRETTLARTFVELADTLVADFDVTDVLTLVAERCVAVLEVDTAGVMLADAEGQLRVVASSSEAMRVLELFELESAEGPCVDAFKQGAPVAATDLRRPDTRWPAFATEAVAAGFHAADAVPLRLRGVVIGALNMFRQSSGRLETADLEVAQALADVATIAILQHRAATEAGVLNAQLQRALDSRVAIEQAKGMVAERLSVSLEEAFAKIRAHARNGNLRLADVATDVTSGALPSASL
jgi:GAF domain-containing protein